MNNDITALRGILFDTLNDLKNKDNPPDIERAKAINDTAQMIINTAKVEVDYQKATGEISNTKFIPTAINSNKSPTGHALIGASYVHRIGEKK